jgi:hypothetical protein
VAKKSDVHVVKTKDGAGWDTTQGGQQQSHHRTQQAAIDKATTVAKREKVDVVTHGRDGKIRSKDSYGNESATRDREH